MATSTRSKLEKALVGPAGEHYCMSHLLLRGYMATLAPRNAPEVDILVLSPDATTTVATIQVKTRTRGPDRGWHMKDKHEHPTSPRMFYAFVDFEPPMPNVYVLPASKFAEVLTESYRTWLATPGQRGQPRKDGSYRRLLPEFNYRVEAAPSGWLEPYLDHGDSIGDGMSTTRAPALGKAAGYGILLKPYRPRRLRHRRSTQSHPPAFAVRAFPAVVVFTFRAGREEELFS